MYTMSFFFFCVDEKRDLEGREPLRPIRAERGQKPWRTTKERERGYAKGSIYRLKNRACGFIFFTEKGPRPLSVVHLISNMMGGGSATGHPFNYWLALARKKTCSTSGYIFEYPVCYFRNQINKQKKYVGAKKMFEKNIFQIFRLVMWQGNGKQL